MAESPVFDRTCEQLEELTSLERIEVRGTVRIALKAAGLAPGSVDATQMTAVLRKLLPDELAKRGVADGEGVCARVTSAIEGIVLEGTVDRAGAAASAMERFGT